MRRIATELAAKVCCGATVLVVHHPDRSDALLIHILHLISVVIGRFRLVHAQLAEVVFEVAVLVVHRRKVRIRQGALWPCAVTQ